jgi:transposase
METLHRRCAGLDVHQKEIVACRRLVSGQKARSELARFPTTTRGLVDLSTWLSEAKVTHVVTRHLGVRIRNSVLKKDILPDNIIR